MKKISKLVGWSEGASYTYIIILFLLELYIFKNYISLWYAYLIMPIIAILINFVLIYFHIIIDYILKMGLPDKEKEYEWKIQDLREKIYELEEENKKLKNKK